MFDSKLLVPGDFVVIECLSDNPSIRQVSGYAGSIKGQKEYAKIMNCDGNLLNFTIERTKKNMWIPHSMIDKEGLYLIGPSLYNPFGLTLQFSNCQESDVPRSLIYRIKSKIFKWWISNVKN